MIIGNCSFQSWDNDGEDERERQEEEEEEKKEAIRARSIKMAAVVQARRFLMILISLAHCCDTTYFWTSGVHCLNKKPGLVTQPIRRRQSRNF
jgi:hypothetical protein